MKNRENVISDKCIFALSIGYPVRVIRDTVDANYMVPLRWFSKYSAGSVTQCVSWAPKRDCVTFFGPVQSPANYWIENRACPLPWRQRFLGWPNWSSSSGRTQLGPLQVPIFSHFFYMTQVGIPDVVWLFLLSYQIEWWYYCLYFLFDKFFLIHRNFIICLYIQVTYNVLISSASSCFLCVA